MATPENDPLQALETPGRLVRNPTSFTGSFPYGGTELGLVRDVAWVLTETRSRITAEEYGCQVVGDLITSESFSVSFAMRGSDDDALAAIWPNSAAGTKSQRRVLSGARHHGKLVENTLACALLFVPDNPEHPAVILPRAVPRRGSEPVACRLGQERLLITTWLALPGANGLPYQVGPMVDFTALT